MKQSKRSIYKSEHFRDKDKSVDEDGNRIKLPLTRRQKREEKNGKRPKHKF